MNTGPSLQDAGSVGPGNCSGSIRKRCGDPDFRSVSDDQGDDGLPHLAPPRKGHCTCQNQHTRENDLETDCSCPDYSNPCKHVAAVYLLLGEEFDRDPFLIFRLRGLEYDRLLGDDFRRAAQTLEAPLLAAEPLPSDSEDFWLNPLARLDEKDYAGPAEPPEADASLPQQLGRFPFWRGEQDFATSLQGIYRAASRRAKEVYEDQHNLTSRTTKAGLTSE